MNGNKCEGCLKHRGLQRWSGMFFGSDSTWHLTLNIKTLQVGFCSVRGRTATGFRSSHPTTLFSNTTSALTCVFLHLPQWTHPISTDTRTQLSSIRGDGRMCFNCYHFYYLGGAANYFSSTYVIYANVKWVCLLL